MLLKFTSKETTEFKDGAFYRKNDGEPFEVSDLLGNELLKAVTRKDIQQGGGETVPVFVKHEKKVSKSALPPDFPMRDELEAAGFFTLEDLAPLTIDSHTDLKGIGKTTMQRILDARDSVEISVLEEN